MLLFSENLSVNYIYGTNIYKRTHHANWKRVTRKFKDILHRNDKESVITESKKEEKTFWSMKGTHQFPRYVREIPKQPLKKAISQLRLSSHTLPINMAGLNILRKDRICTLCDLQGVGAEFHCTFICTHPQVMYLRDELTKLSTDYPPGSSISTQSNNSCI